MMGTIKELTSEQLRDIYCGPENTDDPESIDFEDDEPGETYFDERDDKNVFKN